MAPKHYLGDTGQAIYYTEPQFSKCQYAVNSYFMGYLKGVMRSLFVKYLGNFDTE